MLISVFLTAEPAPLILATIACHVITARNLLYTRLAFSTISDIPVLCSPAKEILIHYSITPCIPMPCLSTLKAHLIATLALNAVAFSLTHEMCTVRSRTPSQVRIHIYINVLLEFEVFFIHFLWTEFSNVFSCVFCFATSVSAFNYSYLTIIDIEI